MSLAFCFLQSSIFNLQSSILNLQDAAPVVSSVTLTGNRALARNRFTLETRKGQPFSESLLEHDRQQITNTYGAYGFFWATVTDTTYGDTMPHRVPLSVAVVFRIAEREQARLGNVRLLGNRMIATTKLRTLLPVRAGGYTESGVKENIRALLDFYGDNGYPFCSIRPDSIQLEYGDTIPHRVPASLSYALVITEGSEVRLSDVRFAGRIETRSGILKRILGLKLNKTYSESETRKQIARLAGDPLITVEGYDIRKTESEYWLEVRVQEQKSNRIAGAVAYAAQEKELVGALNLNLDNLFGTRRAVDLAWQRVGVSSGRQDLSFAYTEPWFLGTSVTLSGVVSNRLRDSSYSATEFSLSGQAPIADRLRIRLGTGYDLVASLSDQPSSRTYWANSGLDFDTRDRPGNPSRGIYADLAIRAGSRQPDTLAMQTIARSELDVTGIVPLGRRFALALSGHGRNVYSPDTIYDYDLIEVGGANSLRGFKEGQFLTGRCAWFTCEPRYLTSRTSRIYPFFDVAVVQDPDRGNYDWHSAYGVGLGVVTAIGTVGLDYGVALNTSPLKGKVHFSIQTSF